MRQQQWRLLAYSIAGILSVPDQQPPSFIVNPPAPFFTLGHNPTPLHPALLLPCSLCPPLHMPQHCAHIHHLKSTHAIMHTIALQPTTHPPLDTRRTQDEKATSSKLLAEAEAKVGLLNPEHGRGCVCDCVCVCVWEGGTRHVPLVSVTQQHSLHAKACIRSR